MEGNACYKFSTINNYIRATSEQPIQVALDIGANVGHITEMMLRYFPLATVHAMEVVPQLLETLTQRFSGRSDVRVHPLAVTASHMFDDELGQSPLAHPRPLQILEGLPAAGPGWRGGSTVVPVGIKDFDCEWYAPRVLETPRLTLDEVVNQFGSGGVVDLIKFDCEGCELSSIGCASAATLAKVRFIVGEYHNFERFYAVLRHSLSRSHRVNLIGDKDLGAFFAEPHSNRDAILHRASMKAHRPWLLAGESEWHGFNKEFVCPGEEWFHAIS